MVFVEVVIQVRHGAVLVAQHRFSVGNPRYWIAGLVSAVLVFLLSGTASAATVTPSRVAVAQPHPPRPTNTAPTSSRTWIDPSVRPDCPRLTVAHGFTMWGIAQAHLGDGARHKGIEDLNKDRIPNPAQLYPGDVLLLPPDATGLPATQPSGRTVDVQPGDTASIIAARECGDPNAWLKLWHTNKYRTQPDGRAWTHPDTLLPGWTLWITDDDGCVPHVAPPVVNRNPAPPPAPVVTENPPQSQPVPPPTVNQHTSSPPTVVHLPSGALVGIAFAVLIAAAATTFRLRRRRQRRLTGTLHHRQSVPPIPPVVRQLERAAAATSPPTAPRSTRWPPSTPHLTVHATDGTSAEIDLTSLAGIGITGDGSPQCVRAAIAAVLADDALYPAELLVVADTSPSAELLIIGDTTAHWLSTSNILTTVPGVTRIDDVDEALNLAETELARRMHLTSQPGHPHQHTRSEVFSSYRDADPTEALPTYLILATPHTTTTARLRAVLELGRTVGMVGILLDPWQNTITVSADGTIIETQGDIGRDILGARLETLSTTDAHDILTTLAAARGGPDSVPQRDTTESENETPLAPSRPDSALVRLRLFGPVTVEVGGTELSTGLRSLGREILAYLAVNPEGAGAETLARVFLPDVSPEASRAQIHTAVSHTRTALRKATGRINTRFINLSAGRYQLDIDLIASDIRDLDTAITTARTEPTDEGRIKALRRVVDLCRSGTPLDEVTFDWAEDTRETLRQQALDALLAFATLVNTSDVEAAIDALTVGITLDPYAEQLYQHLIHIHLNTGHHDLARSAYHRLRTRLADIDCEPSPDTTRALQRTTRSSNAATGHMPRAAWSSQP
ncbi:BTAD domain-containing putative transcriptional regulator [Actinocrispum wychmicini]|uniref:DNA-binding SARP family transcriptional activator n=1 Tax=Actinocrispum wychmicini TaxID=1213861 RepID=A0A4R2JNZ9_9PSEU|nr:BTAD domain-containing putative transcriptional regulator [Actinocrispum wychmicini]TCO61094.1 DNA-binding SARP family transcriptional activator [Actinocrispum wychmicini]